MNFEQAQTEEDFAKARNKAFFNEIQQYLPQRKHFFLENKN